MGYVAEGVSGEGPQLVGQGSHSCMDFAFQSINNFDTMIPAMCKALWGTHRMVKYCPCLQFREGKDNIWEGYYI